MIKNDTGKRVEKKSMVCHQCVTLMTPTAYRENGGVCQLCKNGSSNLKLLIIYYTLEDDEEPYIKLRPVKDEDDVDELVNTFREVSELDFQYLTYRVVDTFMTDDGISYQAIVTEI